MSGTRQPARSGLRAAAATALGAAALVVALGWATGFRQVLHSTLLALGAVAFLPLLVVCAVFALLLILGVALALAGADAGPLEGGPGGLVFSSEGGAGPVLRWTRAYYGLLLRLRHPVWLGAAIGTALGALVCWLLIGWLIVPRETATLARLLVAQQRLEEHRRRDGHYPEPGSQRQLVLDGAACLDAFGTPLRYELRAAWPAQRYRLTSSGADTRASADDMCVAGKALTGSVSDVLSPLARAAARAETAVRAPLALLERVTGKHSSWSSRLALLRELRCTDSD